MHEISGGFRLAEAHSGHAVLSIVLVLGRRRLRLRSLVTVRLVCLQYSVGEPWALYLYVLSMYKCMHARGRGGRGMHVPQAFKNGVSLGSKRLALVPLGACARRCRFRSHCRESGAGAPPWYGMKHHLTTSEELATGTPNDRWPRHHQARQP